MGPIETHIALQNKEASLLRLLVTHVSQQRSAKTIAISTEKFAVLSRSERSSSNLKGNRIKSKSPGELTEGN